MYKCKFSEIRPHGVYFFYIFPGHDALVVCS